MSIKRRLFFSNIRMVFLTFGSFFLAIHLVRIIFSSSLREVMRRADDFPNILPHEFLTIDIRVTIPLLILVIFIIIISLVNSFLTHRMTKRIVKPLEPLSEGVRQIQSNNFTYRIDHKDNDEFTPVCEAFNEMAAKLESSTAQQKKDEANRRELIAGISHDLRTPLTSIKVSISGIKSGVASTVEQQNKYLDFIESKATDMELIIEQLFLLSKLDMDEYQIEKRSVNCAMMIEDCIEEMQDEYKRRGLVISAGVLPSDTYISLDPLLFRRVILNIVENALKYKIAETGHLTIECVKAERVTITISDDGPGIAPENIDKIFDVFYRTDQSRSNKGTGLGLAICEKIITSMGGNINAELPPSGGLAIVIDFPLLDKNHE